ISTSSFYNQPFKSPSYLSILNLYPTPFLPALVFFTFSILYGIYILSSISWCALHYNMTLV
ncbi:MAG: hypothetical protein WA099_10855, partial [Sulfuricurvum sp.]